MSFGKIRQEMDAYFKDISRFPVPTREEEIELFRRYKSGDKRAREEIIVRNLRFVVKWAHKHTGYGLPLEDLVQEGNIGMLTAIDKFDTSRNVRFLTYAVHWIRAKMMLYVFHNFFLTKRFTTQEIKSRFFREFKYFLSMKEVSLNVPVGDGPHEFMDFISDAEDGPEELLMKKEAILYVRECIERSTNNERNRQIIHRRLLSDEPDTLQEIASDFGLSRERIRQIEQKMLENVKDELSLVA